MNERQADGDGEMKSSFLVQTPYGRAQVLQVVQGAGEARRKYELELIDWAAASGKKLRPRLWTCRTYPSISPRVGSHVVVSCFQRPLLGRVFHVRPLDRIAVVRLYDWCLLGEKSDSFVTCYLSYKSLQVILYRKSSQLSKLLDIQDHKTIGYQLYRSHNWRPALEEFHRTSSLIAEHLTAKQRTLLRGNLMLNCIKCCNYMAICKLWLNDLAASIKYCMDALYLMRSLEDKGKRRYRDYFGKYSGEVRVFGCWRIKSLQIMSHVFLEKKQYSAAKDLLKQAHKNAQKYNVKPTNLDMEKRVAQLYRADRGTLRLFSVVARQLAGHDAAKEASRLWLLDDVDDDAHWPPLPIDENAEETTMDWMTPPRRKFGKIKNMDSPVTYLTESSSFDTTDNYSLADSCDNLTQDTASTAASFFRNMIHGKNSVAVAALVPSDSNIHARDKKVFQARKSYLEQVVKKSSLSGRTITIDDPTLPETPPPSPPPLASN